MDGFERGDSREMLGEEVTFKSDFGFGHDGLQGPGVENEPEDKTMARVRGQKNESRLPPTSSRDLPIEARGPSSD